MKKILVLLMLTLSAALLQADPACSDIGLAQPGYNQPYPAHTTNPNSPNKMASPPEEGDQLTALIHNTLRNDQGSRFGNVSVRVNAGYVTLSGTVANQNDKNALEQLVLGIKGVNGITSRVTLK